jgi:hypothetical protein
MCLPRLTEPRLYLGCLQGCEEGLNEESRLEPTNPYAAAKVRQRLPCRCFGSSQHAAVVFALSFLARLWQAAPAGHLLLICTLPCTFRPSSKSLCTGWPCIHKHAAWDMAVAQAGAEMMARAYYTSYKMPIVVTRGNNVYGPHQVRAVGARWRGHWQAACCRGLAAQAQAGAGDTCSSSGGLLWRLCSCSFFLVAAPPMC